MHAKRHRKSPTISLAYEDVRIVPVNQLHRHIAGIGTAETHSEDEGGDDHDSHNTQPEPNNHASDAGDAHPPHEQSSDINTRIAYPRVQKELPTFLAYRRSAGQPNLDIAGNTSACSPTHGDTLKSSEQQVLQSITKVIGHQQVTASKLSFAPSWIVQNAFESELDNWKDVYEQVDEASAPANANIIRSHTVYKVKSDEQSTLKLKARIVAHGNEDKEKDFVRKDSSAAQFTVIRLLLSAAAYHGFRLGKIDVKKAYLQSGPIRRQVYVRPPKEYYSCRNSPKRKVLWKLSKLPYGIVEAGRQWQLTAESWLLGSMQFQRIPGLSQIFIKRNDTNCIMLLVVKVIDDFLVSGCLQHVKDFVASATAQFEIGTVVIDETIKFNGTEISQTSDGTILLSMQQYMSRVQPILLSRSRSKQREHFATNEELHKYLHLAGTLNFLGKGALPPASFVTSKMLQKSGKLTVTAIIDANAMVKEIYRLSPTLQFRCPNESEENDPFLCTFSDAAYNISSSHTYGQTGIFSGLALPQSNGTLFHPLDWFSNKQRRVSYSSFGAEILACADADDRTYPLRQGLRILLNKSNLQSHLNVDSRGLFDTLSTLHEGRDYRLRETVQRIRDSFESKEIDVLRWIKGTSNISDALTKRNIVLYQLLNDICRDGVMYVNLDNGFELYATQWFQCNEKVDSSR